MHQSVSLTPTSLVKFGYARRDITPPISIYHRMWGAANHHRSTGVHRRLESDILAFGAKEGKSVELLRVQLDLVGLANEQYEQLVDALTKACGLSRDRVIVSCSHSHAAGVLFPDRYKLPGGELIEPYLETLHSTLQEACIEAIDVLQDATITYATGECGLAVNRDYWDEANQMFVCGYNPHGVADKTLVVARVTDRDGSSLATIVNYGCHPTTLAWENTLISPDYVGAMRELVEKTTGCPCIFLLGACGDLAPRHGYVSNTDVADKNGLQLGHATLSTLASMGPPANDFCYAGPVISGATLGTWQYRPLSNARQRDATRFAVFSDYVSLPLKLSPDTSYLEAQIEAWGKKKRLASEIGNAVDARDASAMAERARRSLSRLRDRPKGDMYPLRITGHRMGDALWITCGGEPHNLLQVELRRRFPTMTLVVSPVSGDWPASYIVPAENYGKGLYQEEVSPLAHGCFETLLEEMSTRIEMRLLHNNA